MDGGGREMSAIMDSGVTAGVRGNSAPLTLHNGKINLPTRKNEG